MNKAAFAIFFTVVTTFIIQSFSWRLSSCNVAQSCTREGLLKMSMSSISVKKAESTDFDSLRIKTWPTWGCGVSKFPWTYDSSETSYFIKGKVGYPFYICKSFENADNFRPSMLLNIGHSDTIQWRTRGHPSRRLSYIPCRDELHMGCEGTNFEALQL